MHANTPAVFYLSVSEWVQDVVLSSVEHDQRWPECAATCREIPRKFCFRLSLHLCEAMVSGLNKLPLPQDQKSVRFQTFCSFCVVGEHSFRYFYLFFFFFLFLFSFWCLCTSLSDSMLKLKQKCRQDWKKKVEDVKLYVQGTWRDEFGSPPHSDLERQTVERDESTMTKCQTPESWWIRSTHWSKLLVCCLSHTHPHTQSVKL